jgi:hypothetical protein
MRNPLLRQVASLQLAMTLNLLTPTLFALVFSFYADIVKETPAAAVTPQFFGIVAGSLADTFLLQKADQGWFENPPAWRVMPRQMGELLLVGAIIALVPGMALGYGVILGPLGQPLGDPALLGISVLTLFLFAGVFPALYLAFLRVALQVIPASLVRDSSLVLRNVFMTILLLPWNFVIVARFLTSS